MFFGSYTHNFDDKSRLTLPAKYREGLEGGVVVTKGADHCLYVFPRAVWEPFAEKLNNLPLADPSARRFVRLMFAGAADAVPDRQGRILIPPALRTYANLAGDQAVIIGLSKRLEIWNPEQWTLMESQSDAETDTIFGSMMGLGI